MSKHIFNLRMTATYKPPENDIDTLNVEALVDNLWTTLDLDTRTPGFLIFVYAMFTCQHTYLRTNGTERELSFNYAQGSILVETSEDWQLEKVDVRFDVKLTSGTVDSDTIDYIVSRMQQCPVSKNLPENIISHTRIEFLHG